MGEKKTVKRKGSDPLYRAAIVLPLDYDSRKEHLVVYFSTDWEELVPILTDPVEAFARRQHLWSYDGLDALPWSMEPPIVARLRCGGGSERAQQLLDLAFQTLPLFASGDGPPSNPFPGGAFIAEFAIGTRTMTLYFYPPQQGLDHVAHRLGEPEPAPAPTKRYHGALTTVTVGTVGKGLQSIHFDVQDKKGSKRLKCITAETRAKFCVDFMENPFSILDLMDAGKVLSFKGDMVPQAGTIKLHLELPEQDHTVFTLSKPSQPGSWWESYPEMTIEGLSWYGWNQSPPGATPTACVCGQCPAHPIEGGSRIMEVILKNYYDC